MKYFSNITVPCNRFVFHHNKRIQLYFELYNICNVLILRLFLSYLLVTIQCDKNHKKGRKNPFGDSFITLVCNN